MKILVNGPSVSLGRDSWPVLLQKSLDCQVMNFSRIGCGNRYIHDSTMLELSQRSYDAVIISWTYFFRMDSRTKGPDAILHGAELEDITVYDNAYLDRYWIFERTEHPGWTQADILAYTWLLNQYLDFKRQYNIYYSDDARLEETLLYIISLQGFLKSSGIPYLFTFYKPLLRLKKFQHLYDQIDLNCVHDVHLCHLARRLGQMLRAHPTKYAHQEYLQTLLAHPNIKNLARS
jgi:hypothetical protein